MRLFLLCVFVAFVQGVDVDGITLVPTPHGWRPKQCVHTWPSGSVIRDVRSENRTEITLPSGEIVSAPQLPECMKFDYQVPGPRIANGWLDNAGFYTNVFGDTTEYVENYAGYYTLPQTPAQNGATIYYFIGTQNNAGGGGLGLTILQPVLTYYYSWYMQSWNCCPNGQSHTSSAISGFGPGNTVYGKISERGGEDGTWDILSQYGSASTTLTVADAERDFNWIDATLETYSVGNNCALLPSGSLTYSSLSLQTQNSAGASKARTINWDSVTGATGCAGSTAANPTTVVITHN